MIHRLLCASALLVLAGCASTTATFFNRPVVEDSIKDVASTVSLASDRRTVIVATSGANRGRFCAEPPPDTATGLKTELEASLKAKLERAKADLGLDLKDKAETTVVVVAERTAPLDAFRTGVYALCQYHLNGAIADGQLHEMFRLLVTTFEKTNGVPALKVGAGGDGQ